MNAVSTIGEYSDVTDHRQTVRALGQSESWDFTRDGIVGRSRVLRNVLEEVDLVAPTEATVLICGETGTGKELIARAIHARSPRRGRPLVNCNCAAIPETLLESELFGHEKGAFTGAATQRSGRFEVANHGTLFLDEIGELPLELQPKLLRVLQERTFERLGSSRSQHADVRLVAATNANLRERVAEGEFRADLYYRLNVFPIALPPLRDRQEDIPALVWHFTLEFAGQMGRRITSIPSSSMDALTAYPWPGNIRELQNLVERAVIRSASSTLEIDVPEVPKVTEGAVDAAGGTLRDAERTHILATLKETRWVLAGPRGAAKRLGINRSTLQFRMKRLGIERPALLA